MEEKGSMASAIVLTEKSGKNLAKLAF